MASNYTNNFHLSQWSSQDAVLRDDFNADNAKLDSALSLFPQLVYGSYTGDGAATRTVELGFTPSALFVVGPSGTPCQHQSGVAMHFGGLVFPDKPAKDTYKNRTILAICENGFNVGYDVENGIYIYSNVDGFEYWYVAVR